MSSDRVKGRFLPGHKGTNQFTKTNTSPNSSPPSPADADFNSAVLHAAQSFGRAKPKLGLAGYCASLRDHRPQDFAVLVKQASARQQAAQANAAAHIPITVAVIPCPSNFFMPAEEARASWVAKNGTPLLVIDNTDTPGDTSIEDDTLSDPLTEDDDDDA